jgi:excisionase family DNA binding protein
MSGDALTTGQAAAMLGVSSLNTVKNSLEAGEFPGAFTTAGGHWRFLRADVEAERARMCGLREKTRAGDVTPAEQANDYPPSPLL